MWTDKQFWKDATWRAFRTFCQTLASMFGGMAFNILTAPWSSVLSVAVGAALISLWQSIDRERAAVASPAAPPTATAPPVPLTFAARPTGDASLWAPSAGCGTNLR